MKPDDESFHSPPVSNGYRRDFPLLDSCGGSQIRVITLRRRGNTPLGFSIRGGWEHGTGIFVSEVQAGSIAQRQGLRVGDQIVRINGFSIHRAIHMEVLSLLKTCPGVVLKVKRVGILPVKEKRKDPVTWKVVDPNSSPSYMQQAENSRNEYIAENCIIMKIEFTVPGSSSLGCSIAKGPPEMPGIFMCTVKDGGVADQAGLEVGDQIMDMNGTSLFDIKLSDAVALMKSNRNIRLTVKKGAGICLFTEHSADEQLIDRIDRKQNESHSNYPSPKHRQSALLKEHDFSGSSSSKSEESSFQSSVSSDSEKDYSISEESGINSLKSNQNGNGHINRWHKKSMCRDLNESSSSASTEVSKLDNDWIVEERKKLEEEQRKLFEEKERLEEEKRRLQLEKVTSQPLEKTVVKGSFLDELQKVAAKMNIKDDKLDIDQLVLERRNNNASKSDTMKQGSGGKQKCQDDVLKKRQHEMLMEEFREAHKKMFGQQNGVLLDKSVNSKQQENTEHVKPIYAKSLTPTLSAKEDQKCTITVNGQHPSSHSQTLPRPERALISPSPKTSVDDMDNPGRNTTASPINFRITFDTKKTSDSPQPPSNKKQAAKLTLVEVSPWTTRL